MSFYTPFWAGIENDWYRNPEIDAVWKPDYDKLVEQLVIKYAPYIYPFAKEVLSVIDQENQTSFAAQRNNNAYYVLTRAHQMARTRELWLDAVEREKNRIYVCPVCKSETQALRIHPDIIREYGTNPPWCRTCNYVVRRYTKFWGDDTKRKLGDVMSRLSVPRNCDICTQSFSLEEDVFTYDSFGGKAVDLLYPNLFANICPVCFKKAFDDYKSGTRADQLRNLYQLFLLIGKIPTRDFGSLFFLFRERQPIVKLVSLLHEIRTPEGYEKEFGSLFAALVKAGVLPEGSKKMVIGTMVLAKDGHLCLSMVEKQIDDFLFESGIKHDKEVHYPSCDYRTDWELFGGNTRTFVEYFGLMSNFDYATKAALKQVMAAEAKINLIALYPETAWKEVLLRWTEMSEQKSVRQ